jgi:hypothetical protein
MSAAVYEPQIGAAPAPAQHPSVMTASPAIGVVALRPGFQRVDEGAELARLAEVAIDRGEADIGDVVEALQPLHHQFADLLGGHIAIGRGFELADDAVDHPLDPLGSAGRLRSAISIERASLSRSNGMRRPERLTTVSSLSCTRSKVVKRPPQSGQTRRRRIDVLSSVGRLSFTCVSSELQ